MANAFDGVKVFSATMVADRTVLGDKVTEWMARHPSCEVVDMTITQSSDSAFHCVAITVFWRHPSRAAARLDCEKCGEPTPREDPSKDRTGHQYCYDCEPVHKVVHLSIDGKDEAVEEFGQVAPGVLVPRKVTLRPRRLNFKDGGQ